MYVYLNPLPASTQQRLGQDSERYLLPNVLRSSIDTAGLYRFNCCGEQKCGAYS